MGTEIETLGGHNNWLLEPICCSEYGKIHQVLIYVRQYGPGPLLPDDYLEIPLQMPVMIWTDRVVRHCEHTHYETDQETVS